LGNQYNSPHVTPLSFYIMIITGITAAAAGSWADINEVLELMAEK
jgi:hypothetical protein